MTCGPRAALDAAAGGVAAASACCGPEPPDHAGDACALCEGLPLLLEAASEPREALVLLEAPPPQESDSVEITRPPLRRCWCFGDGATSSSPRARPASSCVTKNTASWRRRARSRGAHAAPERRPESGAAI